MMRETDDRQDGVRLTEGLAVVHAPRSEEAHPAAYGLGRIFQVAPRQAGILLNLRAGGVPVIDFEMGVDLVLFDEVQGLDAARAIPLKRNQSMAHPRTGAPLVLAKYPGNIGFVPRGARRPDGTAHPHAGTGFSLGTNIAFPADFSVRRHQDVPDPYHCMELQQYRYDGARFEVTDQRILETRELLEGWDGWGGGLSAALPDGDDMLMAFYGGPAADAGAEPATRPLEAPLVMRWRWRNGAWSPVEAHPVADAAGCMEPSMIRGRDGALYLCARHGWPPSKPAGEARLRVWRSADGIAWRRCLDRGGLRSGGPLVLSRTVGGRPFVMGNGLNAGRHSRASISLWPLSDDGSEVLRDTIVFDADVRFGPAPVYAWNADHALGAVVRLGDGRLHALEAIRVCENTEVVRDTLPTPSTGCYIEEVFADGDAHPLPIWA